MLVVPFVKPLTKKLDWYTQNIPEIESGGRIIGKVWIGEPRRGAKQWYEIKLAVLEEGKVPEVDKPHKDVPSSPYGISKGCRVYRVI